VLHLHVLYSAFPLSNHAMHLLSLLLRLFRHRLVLLFTPYSPFFRITQFLALNASTFKLSPSERRLLMMTISPFPTVTNARSHFIIRKILEKQRALGLDRAAGTSDMMRSFRLARAAADQSYV
jgi:hypothetical protein